MSVNRILLARLSKLALGLYWLALVVATHIPPGPQLAPVETNDKVLHFLAYGALAFLVCTTWELAAGVLNGRHLVFAWLAVVAFGAIDELTQMVVGRDCSVWDWLADACGAAIGVAVFVVVRRIVRSRPNREIAEPN
jgi:VanZ family protein